MKTMKNKIEKPRPVVVMKSGERMCVNRKCKDVFRPNRFGQVLCDKCESIGIKPPVDENIRGRAISARPGGHVKLKLVSAMAAIMIIFSLTSCHRYMTDRQIRSSLETFQNNIDSLHREQRAIMDEQKQLFNRYRVLYTRLQNLDYPVGLSANDSLDIATQLLMCQISINETAASMRTMSQIYRDIWAEINNMYVSIDELEYYCEQNNRDPESVSGRKPLDSRGKLAVGILLMSIGAVWALLNILFYKFNKKRKNGKSKTCV